ncbi:hypothetical protein EXIGLDRAFT_723346 [Exidia glandulosa HHB12029]|uniref:Uncharacterized protein n=1 Tax=Exidia glandulosa HHB12029 TaxID=1314781 RepID=A0A166A231_EXIGL|nr:hypothetical protein EXIGLDRAFT_723346 [Exidia glandulosa HHB12029]
MDDANLSPWARSQIARISGQRRVLDAEFRRTLQDIPREYNALYADRLKAEIADRHEYTRRCALLDAEARAIREYDLRHRFSPQIPQLSPPSPSSSSSTSYESSVSSGSTQSSASSMTSYSSRGSRSSSASWSKLPPLYPAQGGPMMALTHAHHHPTPNSSVSPLFVIPPPVDYGYAAPSHPSRPHVEQIWYPGMTAYRDEYHEHFKGRTNKLAKGPPYRLLRTPLQSPTYPDWACNLHVEAETEHARRLELAETDFVRAKVARAGRVDAEDWYAAEVMKEEVAELEAVHFEQLMSLHEEHLAVFFHVLRDEFIYRTGLQLRDSSHHGILKAISEHHVNRPRITHA